MKHLGKILGTFFIACLIVGAINAGRVTAEVWNANQTFAGGVLRTDAGVVTAAQTPLLTENFYTVDTSGGAVLITLPAAATCTGNVWTYLMTTAGNAASFTPSAIGELLDGTQGAYAGMDAVGDSVTIYCDGSNFFFTGRYIH